MKYYKTCNAVFRTEDFKYWEYQPLTPKAYNVQTHTFVKAEKKWKRWAGYDPLSKKFAKIEEISKEELFLILL
jgi:hypothetical protein